MQETTKRVCFQTVGEGFMQTVNEGRMTGNGCPALRQSNRAVDNTAHHYHSLLQTSVYTSLSMMESPINSTSGSLSFVSMMKRWC